MPTSPRRWLFIYVALILAVLIGGGWFLRHEEKQIRRQVIDQLESIGQLKNHQIQQWRAERLGDAQVLVDMPFAGEIVSQWLDAPSPERTGKLLGWFRSLQSNYQYSDVILLDAQGQVRLRLAADTGPVNQEIHKKIREAARQHRALLTDLHQVPLYKPHQDVIGPLYGGQAENAPHIGTIILRIDASTFLYPMIQSWPVESRSGETLLVRREGDEILFLNELRHRRDSALQLRLPLRQPDLPAAMVASGQRGVIAGTDYRNVAVIAVGYTVQDTNWFMVTKIDTDEALAPWHLQAMYIVALIVGALLVLTTGLAVVWQSIRKQHYKQALQGEVEERMAEAKTLRTAHLLERAEEIADMGCWEFDFNSKTVWASPSARRIYGVSNENWTIEQVQGIPLPEYRGGLNRALKALLQDNAPYDVEFRIRRPCDGALVDIRSQAEYLAESNKVFGIIQDITKRKQIERDICESESRYRSLFYNNHAVMLLVDPDTGNVIDANPAAVNFYGWTHEELLQKNISDINTLAPEEIQAAMAEAQADQRHTFAFRHRLADGSIREVEVISGQILIDDRERLYSIVQDVSQRHQAEEQRERLQQQLLQAQKLESVGRLAGGVAHDLNNLLSPILGYSEMLQAELESGSSQQEYVGIVHQAALRARDLVRQLLAFGRQQALVMETTDLNQIVRSFIPLLRRTIREDIRIDLNLSPSSARVRVDVGQIEQVIMNLIVNAQDAMPDGGIILLETGSVSLDQDYADGHADVHPGPYVLLKVIDTGSGMSEEVREQIFHPFYTTKKDGQGTGLGLATTYGIVKQHGGHIGVDSQVGQGTVFTIYLPAVEENNHRSEEIPAQPPEGQAATGHGRLMVVEDNEMVRELTVDVLSRGGYTVFSAESGAACLERLNGEVTGIDLLVTDVIMPAMNGKALYKEASKLVPGLKVLYMSGYTENVIASNGMLDTGIAFIQKPFMPKALVAKVREVLQAG